MPVRAPIAITLVLLSVIWGYSWVFLKLGSYDAGPYSFAGVRCLLGGCVLLTALAASGRPFRPRRLPEIFALGLVNTTGLVGLSQWAVTEGAANRTSILVFTMPFWTLLLAWPLLGERVRGAQWAAIACAAAGLVSVIRPWALEGSPKSNLLALAAALAWAVSAIMMKRIRLRGPIDLLQLTAWQMALGAVCLLGIAALSNEAPIVWTHRFIVSLAFTAFVSTAFGWLLWVFLLDRLPAGVASLTTLMIPVVAVVSTSLHLGEHLAPGDLAGIALIVAGLGLLAWKAMSEHRAALSELPPE